MHMLIMQHIGWLPGGGRGCPPITMWRVLGIATSGGAIPEGYRHNSDGY
jgi:hypothetical protein